jgi:hypothetical protein
MLLAAFNSLSGSMRQTLCFKAAGLWFGPHGVQVNDKVQWSLLPSGSVIVSETTSVGDDEKTRSKTLAD